jgi:hypothetical protein
MAANTKGILSPTRNAAAAAVDCSGGAEAELDTFDVGVGLTEELDTSKEPVKMEMGVSPGGMDIMPVTLDSSGSVMIEAIDSVGEMGVSPGGMPMEPSTLPAPVSLAAS